jgi:hypothetical protein
MPNVSDIFGEIRVLVASIGAVNPEPPGPYRPSQWAQDYPSYTYIQDSQGNNYFFDAILRTQHETTTRITEHHVQSGGNISDHAYQMPARLTLEIGMSELMDSYEVGSWASPKSVSAYQTLLKLQNARLPLIVETRLNLYRNMVIEQITAPDDYRNVTTLKCTVILRQIFTADVAVTTGPVPSRPQATTSTNEGTKSPEPPTQRESLLYQGAKAVGITPP